MLAALAIVLATVYGGGILAASVWIALWLDPDRERPLYRESDIVRIDR